MQINSDARFARAGYLRDSRRLAPEQGTGPDCSRRLPAGKPAVTRRARGSAPRLDPEDEGYGYQG